MPAVSTVAELENEIVSDFGLFDTWEEKYQYIIEIGQQLPPLAEAYKDEAHKIKGCQSSVWLHGYARDGRIWFEADSDSTFVKGEIALLVRVLSGQPAADIVAAELGFIDAIGLRQHMAVTRANGLASMIKQMKAYALALGGGAKTQ
jgi:cysteine desulfuration protein SufE